MPFILTPHDTKLISPREITVSLQSVDAISGVPGGNSIEFQFPPVLKSDTKSAKWKEIDAVGYEPQYIYHGGRPRKISLSTTYVVGGPKGSNPGTTFNAATVAQMITRWKAYWYMTGAAAGDMLPVFKIKMYRHLPFGSGAKFNSAWRGKSYNIKHSEEKITDTSGTYNLVTEVTVELELATQITAKDKEPKEPFKNIDPTPAQEWY